MNLSIDFQKLSDIEKTNIYIMNMNPVLNKQGLYSDGTENYRMPMEPDVNEKVTIRFRAGRANIDKVNLVVLFKAGEEKKEMEIVESNRVFDYYEADIQLGTEPVEYYFEIFAGRIRCYYGKRGPDKEFQMNYNFKIVPGFHTPDWAKGAVFYQIFTDRFYNGDLTNDVEDREYIYINEGTVRVRDWYKYPASMGVREFYGGDLEGVLCKMDYLQELGVDVLYFNPLFVSPSNHKYDIQDYDYIDPHLGRIVKDEGKILEYWDNSNEHATKYITRVTDEENLEASNRLFIKLVEEAHRRGMRVILDGVFNHCGSFNKWMDREKIYEHNSDYEKGAYISADSPYRSFFKFNGDSWPYNKNYDGWWGHDTLPKLNYEGSEKLYEYIMDIAKKWVSPPFCADGWRLDVAADLGYSEEYNHKFWRDFRKAVKEANPDAIILAEHYGDPASWLEGDQWDTVMNYDAFMEPVTWFLTGMEKHSDEFRGDLLGNSESFFAAMSHHMSRMNEQSLEVSMNELSNHDHSRFLTRTNRRVGRVAQAGPEAAEQNVDKTVFREAVVIQMTWPGAPTIYYGDEAGLCGWTDPDNRRTYPWGREDEELICFHRDIIRIHKENKALTRGSLKFLGGAHKMISYGRFDREESIAVIINSNYEPIDVNIPVWEIGVAEGEMTRLLLSTEEGYTLEKETYPVCEGKVVMAMPKMSAVILKGKIR